MSADSRFWRPAPPCRSILQMVAPSGDQLRPAAETPPEDQGTATQPHRRLRRRCVSVVTELDHWCPTCTVDQIFRNVLATKGFRDSQKRWEIDELVPADYVYTSFSTEKQIRRVTELGK
ncbi:hypothetical protein N7G274_001245 [Stereocaulon virgatum]|uniref:Uncharacterized protein n=1 Tax=Stereocaulon virgatum TaxID=373712 RepID=A0ABR4AQV4_9LECA